MDGHDAGFDLPGLKVLPHEVRKCASFDMKCAAKSILDVIHLEISGYLSRASLCIAFGVNIYPSISKGQT